MGGKNEMRRLLGEQPYVGDIYDYVRRLISYTSCSYLGTVVCVRPKKTEMPSFVCVPSLIMLGGIVKLLYESLYEV